MLFYYHMLIDFILGCGGKKKYFFLFIFFQNIFRDYRLCLNLPIHVYFIPLTFHLSAKNRLSLPVNLEMDFII